MLMKYLGGVDSVPLCIDSRDENGEHQADKLIEFVKMVQHSFGAINLEDISQPNCYRVLDTLREECVIPVWHDDAQGTACVTLAGLINALKIVGKKMEDIKVVLYGAGAANTTIARLMITDGVKAENIVIFDTKGTLHKNRTQYRDDKRFYRKWELCETTNPNCIETHEEAFKDADVLIALSKPGPDTIKPEWISLMADKAIVFACANPVPEIEPDEAKEAGAAVVGTGRSDHPNQINNVLVFPGLFRGALDVRAKDINEPMKVAASHALAGLVSEEELNKDYILPYAFDKRVGPTVAAAVAQAARDSGVARL